MMDFVVDCHVLGHSHLVGDYLILATHLSLVKFLFNLEDSHILCINESSLNVAYRHPRGFSLRLPLNDCSVKVRLIYLSNRGSLS